LPADAVFLEAATLTRLNWATWGLGLRNLNPICPKIHWYWRTTVHGSSPNVSATSGRQQPTASHVIEVIARLIGAGNFLLDGDTHYLVVGNFQFSHNSVLNIWNRQQYTPLCGITYVAMFN